MSQPDGWFGSKVYTDWPSIVNIKSDPFETARDFAQTPSAMMEFFGHEFWRFVFVQQEVQKLAKTFLEFPPQQDPASFNLEEIKQHLEKTRKKMQGRGMSQ